MRASGLEANQVFLQRTQRTERPVAPNDDGSTWKRVEGNGIPEGPLGRIGVAVSGADSNVVYALIEAKKGGLYRSDDGGEHWSLITDDHRFRQRAWYFTHVWADPKNANTVYIADTGNHCIRMISGGALSTIAGKCGTIGGTGDQAAATAALPLVFG